MANFHGAVGQKLFLFNQIFLPTENAKKNEIQSKIDEFCPNVNN